VGRRWSIRSSDFLGFHIVVCGRESGFERVAGARLGSPEGALELGPAGFDRRKIGRIARQVEELEPGFGQGALDRLRLVRDDTQRSTTYNLIYSCRAGAGWAAPCVLTEPMPHARYSCAAERARP
jgi:hypothetical protein